MAKLGGLLSKARGSVGGTTFLINHGVQIAKAKIQQMSNPSTPAQVASRAKLKLLSQLSANVADFIAIRREALVTARNAFVKANYGFAAMIDGVAQLDLANMQFTKSSVGLVGFSVTRASGYGLPVQLAENVYGVWDKVVWIVCKRLSDGRVQVSESKVVEITEDLPNGATVMQDPGVDCTIHVYGIKVLSERGSIAFSNLAISDAGAVASIVTSGELRTSDIQLSETRGLYLAQNAESAETTGAGVHVALEFYQYSAINNVQLQGAGDYSFGSIVTVTAPAVTGYKIRWIQIVNGATSPLADGAPNTALSYSFTIGSRDVTLYAFYIANE